jgi:hypothetical protein
VLLLERLIPLLLEQEELVVLLEQLEEQTVPILYFQQLHQLVVALVDGMEAH